LSVVSFVAVSIISLSGASTWPFSDSAIAIFYESLFAGASESRSGQALAQLNGYLAGV
jgi:hypothetical protein